MRWFKMHTEARNDQKLDTLTDAQFRVWFRLLCYAAEQEERGTAECDDELLAVEVSKGNSDILTSTIDRLVKLKIIAKNDGLISFVNFAKRQYDKPSDHPNRVNERVKRHRNAKCNAPVTPCNAPVTPPDTEQNRTDTDTEQTQIDIVPYREIVSHLNRVAGTSYRASGKVTRRHIHARWEDGFRLDDFYRVIDIKVAEWSGTKMQQFIRPETLFGTKFESYRNQKQGRTIPKAFQSIQEYVGDDQ